MYDCLFRSAAVNPCARSPCTYLCLLSPVESSGFKCACPSGMVLQTDQISCAASKCNDVVRKCNGVVSKCNDAASKCNGAAGKCNGAVRKRVGRIRANVVLVRCMCCASEVFVLY